MSSQQTSTPPDRSPAGTALETHWSEDRDFQWRAATELLIAMGVPRSTARLTGELRTSVAHLEEVDARLPRDGKPLPETGPAGCSSAGCSSGLSLLWCAGKQVRKSRALTAGSAGGRPMASISRKCVKTLVIQPSKAGANKQGALMGEGA